MIRLMKLSKINNTLVILIVLLNLYVIVTPIVPGLAFIVSSRSPKRQELTRQLHPQTIKHQKSGGITNEINHVVIPAMLIDQPILESHDTYAVLNKGVWRWPASSTPDKGGNTVLLGHRFTYTVPKGVFYHLDKLQTGDEIGLVWNSHQYLYKVSSISIVPPTETSIEDNTADARLTLFTCTPLLWPKDRLVIVATLQTGAGVVKL